MNEKKKNVPQLRFPGFTDAWEQRKLGEIAIRVRGNDGRMNLPTLTISAGNGWMDQRDRFSQNIAGKEQKNYTLLRQGELSYNHGNSKLAQFGAVFELESYNEALVPRVYHSFSVTAGAQPKFIEQMFATHRPDRELRKLVSSGARMDGLLNINYDDFMGIKVWLPSVAEQQAIAGLLVKLDKTIALHQRKLSDLKKLKNGLLQKMFPKNGEKYPEIRFPEFTDAWEQRKLGELGKIYTGNTPKTSDLDNWTDNKEGHIWITPTDIDKLIMSDSDRHLSEQGWSKARKIPENSVLITSIASIGKNTINAVPVAFNQQINAIVPEKNDSYFILSAMIKDTARFASVAGQTATAIINKTTFEKFQIATPSYEEQQKIGLFFKQLDSTIALHQRKSLARLYLAQT